MLRRWLLFLLTAFLLTLPLKAQDALDLPADLYILQNDGRVQRFGVGAAGVTTITPEDAYIIDFGVDAPGERIAYRTESGLYVLPIPAGGAPVEIEGADAGVPYFRGAGETVAWSPTGDAIAYTTLTGARVAFGIGGVTEFFNLTESPFLGLSWSPGGRFLAAQAEANVWWIYRREGNTMALTSAIPSSIGTTWVSDSELVFAPAEGSLRLMNLDAANAQIVLLDDSVEYRLPYLNAEDALVFFSRDPASESVPEGYGVLMRLRRGAQQVETIGQVPVALAGLRWTPDGSLLLAFQGGVIALFDPLTGLGFPLPVEGVVAYAWGPLSASSALAVSTLAPAAEVTQAPTETPIPAETAAPQPVSTVTALVLSADSYFLSPDARGVLQVWRMPSTGAPAGQFTGSGSSISEFAVAPDDGSVVYVTGGEMWIQPFSRSQPYQLASIDSFAPTNLTFSPDGTQVAYADESSGIWTVGVDGGDEPLLVLRHANAGGNSAETRVYRHPRYSPDGSKLLLDVYSPGGVSTGVLDLSSGTVTEAAAAPDDPRPSRAEWLADSRAFTYADAGSPLGVDAGFYVFDPLAVGTAPAQWIPFPATSVVRGVREVLPNRLRALLAEGSDLNAPLRVVDFDLTAGAQTDVLTIDGLIAPQVSPDGRFISGYQDVNEVDGTLLGSLLFVDLQNGRRFHLTLPEQSIFFKWRG